MNRHFKYLLVGAITLAMCSLAALLVVYTVNNGGLMGKIIISTPPCLVIMYVLGNMVSDLFENDKEEWNG